MYVAPNSTVEIFQDIGLSSNYDNALDKLKTIYSINIKTIGNWKITLEPGEYYYKHILYPVESDNSAIFVGIYSTKFSFPINSYYAQSSLAGSSTVNVIIPRHFVINDTITLNINVTSISNATLQLNSLIEINKKVK